jgi:hypothetical protein
MVVPSAQLRPPNSHVWDIRLAPGHDILDDMDTSVERQALPTPVRGSALRPLRRTAARLAERVTTPLLPADYLDMFAPLRAGAELRGRIEAVVPETADAATIVIRPAPTGPATCRASTSGSASTSTASAAGAPTP